VKISARAWTPAYDGDGGVRDGAWVAELTGPWTCRPGRRACGSSSAKNARIRVRSSGSPISTGTGSPRLPPALSPGSWLTWNCGTAGPAARTGSAARRTPGCGTCRCTVMSRTQIWCEIVALACELLAWMQMLALTGTARRWEPKRLRLRLFSVAGRIVRRRTVTAATARRPMALVPRHRCRHQPAPGPGTWLTRTNPSAVMSGRKTSRARGTHPTRRDSRTISHRGTLKTRTTRRLKPPTQDHETSRLGRGVGRQAKARTYKTRRPPLA
jgi:hypothetical protein